MHSSWRELPPRQWWKIPMWSTRTAIVTGLAVGALVMIMAGTHHSTPQRHPAARPIAAAKVSSQPMAAPTPTTTDPSLGPARSGAAPAAVTEACRSFLTAWASHQAPATWHKTVDALVVPQLAAGLDLTDPTQVAAHRVGALVHSTGDSGGGQIEFNTDAGPQWCAVAAYGTGYRVKDFGAVHP